MLPGLRPTVHWLCAFLVVGLAFFLYLRFVLAFGVNVPYWDDWQLLDEVRLIQSGHMDWWKLILSKHNEHLVGVGFLIESLQFLITGCDYKLQLVAGVVIQALSFGVLAAALWRFIPENRRPLWLAVSSLIWFSLSQHKNLLWAFQTAWFLVSLLLAVTLVSLCRASQLEDCQGRGGNWFTVAVAAALSASFTLFQGMIIWFAGIVYLLGRQSYQVAGAVRRPLLRKWAISTVLAGIGIGYIWVKLGGPEPSGPEPLSLRALVYIFVGVHGNFWGNLGIQRLIALGAIMLAFVCLALAKVLYSKERAAYALPVSFIAFGTCFVVLVALGRGRFGIEAASDSHYTASVLLTYLGVLSIFMRQDDTLPKFYPSRWGRFIFLAVLLLATFTSTYDAILRGLDWRSERGTAAAILLNYSEEPDFVLARTLFGDPAMVRRNAEFMQVHRYGAFGDPNAVPESITSYRNMPNSMQAMISRYPAQQEAIRRAWYVYQMGSDLRNAFNPLSDHFARDLLNWCTMAAAPTGAHYLSQYLAPFAANYAAIKNAESSRETSR